MAHLLKMSLTKELLEKISRSLADNLSCKMSPIPLIFIFGGVLIICLMQQYLAYKSSKNVVKVFCHQANDVHIYQTQVVMTNTLETSSGKSHPLGRSGEIQSLKKQN